MAQESIPNGIHQKARKTKKIVEQRNKEGHGG